MKKYIRDLTEIEAVKMFVKTNSASLKHQLMNQMRMSQLKMQK